MLYADDIGQQAKAILVHIVTHENSTYAKSQKQAASSF